DPPFEKQLTGQARPNVLFEAGMAFSSHPDRTVLVQLGTIRPFSDIAGRHIIIMSNDAKRRKELADRLEFAGCDVNRDGTDWMVRWRLHRPIGSHSVEEEALATSSDYNHEGKRQLP